MCVGAHTCVFISLGTFGMCLGDKPGSYLSEFRETIALCYPINKILSDYIDLHLEAFKNIYFYFPLSFEYICSCLVEIFRV